MMDFFHDIRNFNHLYLIGAKKFWSGEHVPEDGPGTSPLQEGQTTL